MGLRDQPHVERFAGRQVERDVPAVVHVGARSSPPAAIAAQTSSATAPATAAIGVMYRSANGRTAAAIRRPTGLAGPGSASSSGRRSVGSSATSSSSNGWNRSTPAGTRPLPPSRLPTPDDQVDRAVLQMQPPAVRRPAATGPLMSSDVGRREHLVHGDDRVHVPPSAAYSLRRSVNSSGATKAGLGTYPNAPGGTRVCSTMNAMPPPGQTYTGARPHVTASTPG